MSDVLLTPFPLSSGKRGCKSWTEPAEKHLVALWNDKKYSASEIALAFDVSRGAILGKIARLKAEAPRRFKLEERIQGMMPDGTLPPMCRPGAGLGRRKPRSTFTPQVKIAKAAPAEEPLISPDHTTWVDIHDLDMTKHCREVVCLDSPLPLYCGATRADGSSFCQYHHRQNWIDPQEYFRRHEREKKRG